MFIGHYGMALALKRAEPKLSLGTLFIAVQLVDIAWGATILLGLERVQISPSSSRPDGSRGLEGSTFGGEAWPDDLAGFTLNHDDPERDLSFLDPRG